jgi:flagellar protein FliS
MPVTDDYLENQVLTASPHRLHLLVVDAAIRFARQGLAAMEDSRWEAMDQAFSRARDCVTELIGGINPDVAPDIAESVKSLFTFVYRRLVLGELSRNPQNVQDALKLLQMHRETWVELGAKLQAATEQTPAAAVPSPHHAGRSWVT